MVCVDFPIRESQRPFSLTRGLLGGTIYAVIRGTFSRLRTLSLQTGTQGVSPTVVFQDARAAAGGDRNIRDAASALVEHTNDPYKHTFGLPAAAFEQYCAMLLSTWVSMDRRNFLNGLVGTAFGFLECGCNQETILDSNLNIDNSDVGRLIPPDFMGLSYESSILASRDYFTPDNASLLGLIRLLGGNGIIRIGGNTSERTVWRPDNMPGPDDFPITPGASIALPPLCLSWAGGSSMGSIWRAEHRKPLPMRPPTSHRRLARNFSPSRLAMSRTGSGAGPRFARKVTTWTRF